MRAIRRCRIRDEWRWRPPRAPWPNVVCIVVSFIFGLAPSIWAEETPALFPAFPGAEGAGAYTKGGRGGRVVFVTTLADYRPGKEKPVPGSLRVALAGRGPRTILFRVGGTIDLKTDLSITEPFVTIAGQSAPGGGICLRGSALKVATHEVVIRYLRVRPGDIQRRELDAISGRAHQLILDHVSATWGIDETISTNGDSGEVTVQYCLIGESLNRSVHHKGAHGYGSLISGPGPITYHHNLYAFHRSRNPRAGDVRLDFRNNVVAGWGDRAGYSGDDRLEMNYVANVLRPFSYSNNQQYAFLPGGQRPRIFLSANRMWNSDLPREQRDLLRPPDKAGADSIQTILVDAPFPTDSVRTEPALAAWDHVLADVGATLPRRDSVDTRIVEQVRTGRGRLIDSQTEVGGWPVLAAGTAPADSDDDGMTDAWEVAHGLDSAAAAPSADTDGDGYTDLEEFLNQTDPRRPESWLAPPVAKTPANFCFVDRCRVELVGPPGAAIRFTLDGREPTSESRQYVQPLVIDTKAVLRATSFREGLTSPVRNVELTRLEWQPAASLKQPAPGLRYEYFERGIDQTVDDFATGPATTRGIVPTITLAPRRREQQFGFHFSGYFDAPAEGIYWFSLRCSPRGILHVAGTKIENQSRRREHSAPVALRAGPHPVALWIYFKNDVDKTLEVDVTDPKGKRTRLDATRCLHDALGETSILP